MRALDALQRPRAGLAAVLSFVAFFFLLFCAVDNRPPDDHDDFYTVGSVAGVGEMAGASWLAKPGVLADHFVQGELHPRLAQTALVAAMGTLGRSRFIYRATNLPFLLLLVLGTFLLARELGGDRIAILAAFVVGNAPMFINYSRKWDIQFHAAALTPLGIYFGLAALRSEGARALKLWLAFGVWQGVRLYTHPIVMPDVVATLGLVGIVLVPHGRALGRELVPRLRGYLLAVGVTLLTGLYYLGFAGGLIGEPGYSLRRYLARRGSYSQGGWWAESDGLAKLSHFYELLTEAVWFHFMPLYTALLLPGILLAPLLLRRAAWSEERPGARWLAAVVLGCAVAELPLIALGTSNNAFLNDWLFVAPGVVVLALLALRYASSSLGPRREAWVAGWTVALVAAGVLHHAVPLVARAVGPDPIEEPDHYSGLLLGPFARSSSGRHLTTHHVPTRFGFPGTTVAGQMGDAAIGGVTVLDLTWDPAAGAGADCVLGDPDDLAGWAWAPPTEGNHWARELSPWPFVFGGFDAVRIVRPDHEVDPEVSNWTSPRVPGELPRTAVVRFWIRPNPTWQEQSVVCLPYDRLPEGFFAAGERMVATRFAGATRVGVLRDPTGWLLAQAVEWDTTPEYVGTALLFDLGDSVARLDEVHPDRDAEIVGPGLAPAQVDEER